MEKRCCAAILILVFGIIQVYSQLQSDNLVNHNRDYAMSIIEKELDYLNDQFPTSEPQSYLTPEEEFQHKSLLQLQQYFNNKIFAGASKIEALKSTIEKYSDLVANVVEHVKSNQ
ncbi:uncharacterized protein [Venturia canescens]|uniref:uncharacterized protein n=1 Tax=Venturia canescens TaxID=32260 RepID=UPI001C9C2CB7|nr:uncharacterized protein LOC122418130 [Venturia canescens]